MARCANGRRSNLFPVRPAKKKDTQPWWYVGWRLLKPHGMLFADGQHFHVNAAWFKLSLMACNLVSVLRRLGLCPAERTVRLKRFRLPGIKLAGRMSRFQSALQLRFCVTPQAIERVLKVWEVFALPTQATAYH
jgi:hypothetical protein